MKYSIVTATFLFKVDTRDWFGFALNDAISRYVVDNIKDKL